MSLAAPQDRPQDAPLTAGHAIAGMHQLADSIEQLYYELVRRQSPDAGRSDPCFPYDDFIRFEQLMAPYVGAGGVTPASEASELAMSMTFDGIAAGIRWGATMAAAFIAANGTR